MTTVKRKTCGDIDLEFTFNETDASYKLCAYEEGKRYEVCMDNEFMRNVRNNNIVDPLEYSDHLITFLKEFMYSNGNYLVGKVGLNNLNENKPN